jgi:hypothetical protein
MSSSVTVVGGVSSGTISGSVAVPVSGLSTGAMGALQSSLSALSASVAGGTLGLVNVDTVTGAQFISAPTVVGGSYVLEVTNTDSVGTSSPGTVSASIGVVSAYSSVIIQAPGDFTVTGSGLTNTNYLLGGNSNVDLFTTGGKNTIVAAGGNDTINLQGSANAVTVSGGDDAVKSFTGSNTIVATGSASVFSGSPAGYAGKIDFISSSTAAATIFAGNGSATVDAGTGGGTVLGGTAGGNSLTGGSGSVYFVGGGNGDVLSAGFDGAATVTSPNYLFAGSGNETLLASSVTGTNVLAAGSGSDAMSASGSGTQYFFGSNGTATMTGSTMSGSNNIYFFGTASNSGGNDVITNFGKNSQLIALNGTQIESITSSTLNGAPASLVSLSDGTNVTLIGVNAASISGSQGGVVIS